MLPLPGSGFPLTGARPAIRGLSVPRWPGRAARPPIGLFRGLLMAYCVIAVCKVHELLPDVGNLYAAKIVGAPLILTALFAVPARSFKALLRSPPMKWLAAVVVFAILSVPFALWPGGSVQFLSQV